MAVMTIDQTLQVQDYYAKVIRAKSYDHPIQSTLKRGSTPKNWEEKIEVERLVNVAIQAAVPVICEEMTVAEAKAQGAMGLFESKYGERVKVYTMGEFSKEICGGPHASNTGDLVSFKIQKEESSSAGVRRIKAVIGK